MESKQISKVTGIKIPAKALSSHARSTIRNELHAKIVSLEEFCPDDETLDKSFLDELPTASTHAAASQARRISYDSDSDSNETGNPLVAQFHDDPGDADTVVSATSNGGDQQSTAGTPWENPLAKPKKGDSMSSMMTVMTISCNSTSSDDVEIPTILNETIVCPNNDDGVPNELYDSWLSDTNQRRSPEGGEDEATITGADKAVDVSSTSIGDISLSDVDTKCDRAHDKGVKKKKKKDKKEKSDGKEKKKKKRIDHPDHKHCGDELLTEQVDELHLNAGSDTYEAIWIQLLYEKDCRKTNAPN